MNSISGTVAENSKLVEKTTTRVPDRTGHTLVRTCSNSGGRFVENRPVKSRNFSAALELFIGILHSNVYEELREDKMQAGWLPRSLTVQHKTRRFGIVVSHL